MDRLARSVVLADSVGNRLVRVVPLLGRLGAHREVAELVAALAARRPGLPPPDVATSWPPPG